MSGFFNNILNSAISSLSSPLQKKLGGSLSELLMSEQGIQTLLQQAKAAGLDEKVRSWIGNGKNLPISTEEVQTLLSNEQVQTLISKTGISSSLIMPALAMILPRLVDSRTPDGKVNGEPPATA